MRAPRRALYALVSLVGITGLGTCGYVLVEGLGWLDAFYMTVITLSTVGYGEVRELSPAGRLFTIGLIVTGAGTVLYLASVVAEIVIEGRLRDLYRRSAMSRNIEGLRDHVIVCGYGRFGRVVCGELARESVGTVIVELDANLEPELATGGQHYLIASATSDEVLTRAGIDRARAIVVATHSESDNVFVTLAARELNPRIRIHTRGESEAAIRRLRRAGADHISSPFLLGGVRTAASILRPSVVDFLEISAPSSGEEVDLEEIRIASSSELAVCCIDAIESDAPRVRVVALKRPGERIRLIPEAHVAVQPGDHLVVIGEREGLARLARQSQGSAD